MYKKIYLELVVNPFTRCNENHLFTNGPKSNEWGVVTSQGKILLLTNMGGPFFGIFSCALFDGAYKELLFIWIIYSPMGQKVMNGDGGHFIRKSSFVDQHRWPFSWHFPVCIVLWGMSALFFAIFLCVLFYGACQPFFWYFPMCIVWRYRWPFSWHFPVCIVLWGLSALFLVFSHVHCLTI